MIIFIPAYIIVLAAIACVLAAGISALTLIILAVVATLCLLGSLAICAVIAGSMSPSVRHYRPAYRLSERDVHEPLVPISDNTEELYTRPIPAVKPTEVHNHLHLENPDLATVANLRDYWKDKQNG